jgi:hypothetical protein
MAEGESFSLLIILLVVMVVVVAVSTVLPRAVVNASELAFCGVDTGVVAVDVGVDDANDVDDVDDANVVADAVCVELVGAAVVGNDAIGTGAAEILNIIVNVLALPTLRVTVGPARLSNGQAPHRP